MTLKGVCPQCGAERFGWALAQSERQFCDQCEGGISLVITTVETEGREPWKKTTWWEEIFKAIKPWGLL